MSLIVLLLLVGAVIGSDTGCRIVNKCNGPGMICYENYGNCICANDNCLCDGMCGPVWWLIMIFVFIFLLAVVGLVLILRCCCGCCGGCGKGYIRVS